MKLALDVSAVPPRLAGAGRYIGELARRVPATGVDTTLVTRRDDTLRWHDWSPSTHIASIVPNARPSRLFYGALMAGRSSTARSVDVWHSPHYAMPHRSSTATVVTIHDLTFLTEQYYDVTDVWSGKAAGTAMDPHTAMVDSHDIMLFRLKPGS